MENLPKTKTDLTSQIEREWSALIDAVSQLSPEQMYAPDEGGWSPKDNLAHLTEWMNILLGYYFDHHPDHEVVGVDYEVAQNWDLDTMNDIMFRRNRNQPIEQVMEELKDTYANVRERLEGTSFEDLMKPIFDDDPTRRLLITAVINNTSDHFAEHRETIEKSLKKNS